MFRALGDDIRVPQLLSRSARQGQVHPYGLGSLSTCLEEGPAPEPLNAVLSEAFVKGRPLGVAEDGSPVSLVVV